MSKLTDKARKQIAPFLLKMLQDGLSLRKIEETLSGFKPLTWEAIRNILDRYYPLEYDKIIKGRHKNNK